ncbi:FtsK/SpoIIIE domain-containing protein [Dactylosporangium sp. AC04546]|uniref:FtsK/SpoIIIE domain-containing protein n=1 Tax=Dactylosporangium sp. AC04546 TaxID=2862460 RepID=UPI001EDE5367|nr:FtsK/SpoIIIE domain-containing protein [Dactylosporangium sp. AC04546]WVK82011.1 FtsK/SpoIIIE domain-containing protein [Dactylosporangium sp. AC04546]
MDANVVELAPRPASPADQAVMPAPPAAALPVPVVSAVELVDAPDLRGWLRRWRRLPRPARRPQRRASAAARVGLPSSIFDPVFVGFDEFGEPVYVPLIYRNMLIGGEPGGGKSSLLNVLIAHAALASDCRLVLLDAKQVELGQWEACADVFVGPDIDTALTTLKRLQVVMDNRYRYLRWRLRRKIKRNDKFQPIVLAVDEIAYFSATVGDKKKREDFSSILRDLVARGRAVGIIVVGATQRPSSDIIPTSLRDLFAWRVAFRCTSDSSSDIVLGHGWAARGWTANSIDPGNQGCGLLIAEGGVPKLVKVAWLDDDTCARVAHHAAELRADARRARLAPVGATAGASTTDLSIAA